MRYRLSGTSGLRVSEVFLGAMTIGEESGPGASLEECRRMLDAYAELSSRLDAATNFEIGFPTNFINGTSPWVYREKGQLVYGRE